MMRHISLFFSPFNTVWSPLSGHSLCQGRGGGGGGERNTTTTPQHQQPVTQHPQPRQHPQHRPMEPVVSLGGWGRVRVSQDTARWVPWPADRVRGWRRWTLGSTTPTDTPPRQVSDAKVSGGPRAREARGGVVGQVKGAERKFSRWNWRVCGAELWNFFFFLAFSWFL